MSKTSAISKFYLSPSVLLYSSTKSSRVTSNILAILISCAAEGYILFADHLNIVISTTPNCTANHRLVILFSAITTRKRFGYLVVAISIK